MTITKQGKLSNGNGRVRPEVVSAESELERLRHLNAEIADISNDLTESIAAIEQALGDARASYVERHSALTESEERFREEDMAFGR